ncbi:DMT family transporter [Brevibacillus sp. SAFN-007a]|uniref:DMT family transporter n=1 Tax=Brevibacillus sp. SAFN-007a TaxID=3436862 RepID=UPI003F811F9A
MPKASVLLLFTSFLWGGNFVLGKSLVGHASPLTLTSLRWLIAVLCLLPIVWRKERKLWPAKEAILPLMLMGLTGVVLFNVFQFLALETTTATNIGLISTLNMLSISLFSFVFLKERINRFQIGCMVFLLAGVLLVLSKGNADYLLTLQFNTGDWWMLAAVGVWGVYSICSKWALTMTTPMMSILYSAVFGLVILLPFNLDDFTIFNPNASFVGSLLYTGVISTVVCMVLWNIGVQKLGATTSGIFLNFNPIFTSLLAFLFLGEQLTWMQGVGGIMVIAGCFLFSSGKATGSATKPSAAGEA